MALLEKTPIRPRAGFIGLAGLCHIFPLVLSALLAFGCDKPEGGGAGTENGNDKPTTKEAEKHPDEVKLTAAAIARYGVKVDKVAKRLLTPTAVVPARVSYNLEQTAHVGVPVAGRVAELKARLGDVVKKGDVLVVLDSPELGESQSDYLQKRTALGVAKPAVELAGSSYQRADQLFKESQGIALTEVQKRQGELQAAQGALRTAEAAVLAAESKLQLLGMTREAIDALANSSVINAKYEVLAPIAGQVVEREVTHGELVRPEKESLLVLADLSTLWVIADVPQAHIPVVAVGNRARVLITSASAMVEGKVAYISPQIDPATRTAQVRVEVPTDGTGLRAGMFTQAEIELNQTGKAIEPVLAVSEESVQTVEGGPAVFVPVQGEENTFAMRVISLGAGASGWISVLSGLKDGEEYVVAGSFILKAELGKSSAEED